jgi:hypothetical protein
MILTVDPASVARVIVFPEIALTTPTGFAVALADADC